jgi:hypothetical protein
MEYSSKNRNLTELYRERSSFFGGDRGADCSEFNRKGEGIPASLSLECRLTGRSVDYKAVWCKSK